DWMVFLHPDQRQAATPRHSGPARARGSAGTGKTVVALHRAAELARRFDEEGEQGQILFTTFIKNLPPVFESLFQRLPAVPADRVEFINVDKLAFRICSDAGDRPTIDPRMVEAAYASAFKTVVKPGSPLDGFSREYLRAEITAVIKGRGLKTIDDYLGVERTGRKTRFTEAQRRQAWQLRTDWDSQMAARNTIDFADIVVRARDHARRLTAPRYRAAIIDEAQDLTLVGLQLIRALVNGPQGGDRPDGLFIVGDGAQRIYAGGFTLRQAGVDVRGRTTVLKINYRNTRQIITAAMAVAGNLMVDDLGDKERRGDASTGTQRDGIKPVLKGCDSHDDELAFVIRQIQDLTTDDNVSLGDLAIAVATNDEAKRVREALDREGIANQALESYDGRPNNAVKVGTHFRIKGLEFKVVYLPFLGAADFPRAQRPGQDGVEYAEQRDLAISQLFVAMTRARDGLFLTFTGHPSDVLGPGIDAFEVI
ncbi:MAG: 3'-5' exonuclease, partial [Acidimicrobiia bacterium]